MENASQALFIAAGVLVGILILSLGIALMNMMGGYAAETQNKINESNITQFNDRFLKYNGFENLNIQDIITVKNYALENNKQYLGYNLNSDRAEANNDYIDVYCAETKAKAHNQTALILGTTDEDLLKKEMEKLKANPVLNSNRFICEVEVNVNTGKIYKVYFYEAK